MSIIKALEEFLREVSEQQAAQQQAPPRGAPRPPVRPAPPVRPTAEPVLDAEILDAEPLGAGVSQHVAQHLDTTGMRQRTAQLGSEVLEETQKLQSEVREKFTHKLGRLAATAQPAAPPSAASPPAPARPAMTPPRVQEITQLLRNPSSVRQAVIINEILARPEHRW
jgi:hypothetical protein